jgi:hypothetical protein
MKFRTRLTSIKLLESMYHKFKTNTVENNMTLQRLINRSMHLYVHDIDFRNKINTTKTLIVSGSGF